MELDNMRIVINDAPLWCEDCDEAILGPGLGTYGVLRAVIEEHFQRQHRPGGQKPR